MSRVPKSVPYVINLNSTIGNRISICGNKYLPVILFIPLGKMAEAFAEGDLGGEAKVTLQGSGICLLSVNCQLLSVHYCLSSF